MTAYTTWNDGTDSTLQSGRNEAGAPAFTVLQGVYDAKRRPLASTDTIELIDVPAGMYVTHVFYRVLTADSGVGINVGDGTDPNGWVADADVGTAGNIGIGAGAYAGGKHYTAADTIDIECVSGDAYDTLKVAVTVCGILA